MAANTDKFKKLTNNFSTTLTAAIVGLTDTSMSLASTTNLPPDTGSVFVIDRINSSGGLTPSVREYVIGVVSGSNVIGLLRGVGNSSAQAHQIGAVVEQVVDQRTINDLVDGILQDHDQSGHHKDMTDANGNVWQKQVAATSAVNYPRVANAATSTAVIVDAEGSDTNIDKYYGAKGLGVPRFYGNHDGWVLDRDTWSYVTANSFKVTGKDVTARFPAGAKICLTQTTKKYFYVTSAAFSSDTTVNIAAGSDYSLVNAAITIPFFSYAVTPQGFPADFSWTPTFTNWTVGTSGATIAAFTQIGKTVFYRIRSVLGTSGFSVGVLIQFTLPVPTIAELAISASEGYYIGQAKLLHATIAAYDGLVQVSNGDPTRAFLLAKNAAGTYVTQATVATALPFTWGSGDMFMAEGYYEAA